MDYRMFEVGRRLEFHVATGCIVTMKVTGKAAPWIWGERWNERANHSADRAKTGQPVMVNLTNVLSVADVDWVEARM